MGGERRNNPILSNPDIAMRMQRALAWLVVVVFANWFSSFTGAARRLHCSPRARARTAATFDAMRRIGRR